VVERATGAKTFLHADRLGSIIATASNDGAITGQAKYSPYGVTTGSIPTIFGYTGHQYDREIGIYYARARTYMPLIGRFMQVDPVGYKQSLNLYTYGMGNPMAGTDPSGGFFQFIVPLLQLAAGELSASAFAGLLVNYAINYAIDTAITMALEDAYPGAGRVFGIIRSAIGLASSAGFGGGSGKVEQAATGTLDRGLLAGPAANISSTSVTSGEIYAPVGSNYKRGADVIMDIGGTGLTNGASKALFPQDEFVIAGHGVISGGIVDSRANFGTQTPISPESLLPYLEVNYHYSAALANLKPGQTIRLLSCYGGGTTPTGLEYAQALADASGHPVVAATSLVHLNYENGNFWLDPGGEWRIYYPR